MDKLSLNYTAIGSIPFSSSNAVDIALDYIFKNYKSIPFMPQLPHFKMQEDMVVQFSQNMAGLKIQDNKMFFDSESDIFFEKLEELFFDYEEVVSSNDLKDVEEILDKYNITPPYSNAVGPFLKRLRKENPSFVKGSITGPFTFSTSINDINGKSSFYDETLRDIVVKTLSLKALWQIKEFKKNAPNAKPIIFLDEPSVSQIGSCAFLTVKNEDVISAISSISSVIKKFDAISAIHCCGKTDWEIAINSDVCAINFDAYSYTQNVALYALKIKEYLENGGYIAFGIVPTLQPEILDELDLEKLKNIFEKSIQFFVKKGLSKDLILKQCFITPSCGCGSLTDRQAIKALDLAKELSMSIRENL